MRKSLGFRSLLLLILVVLSKGRFHFPEYEDVDRFQSKAQMNRQASKGIFIKLQ